MNTFDSWLHIDNSYIRLLLYICLSVCLSGVVEQLVQMSDDPLIDMAVALNVYKYHVLQGHTDRVEQLTQV